MIRHPLGICGGKMGCARPARRSCLVGCGAPEGVKNAERLRAVVGRRWLHNERVLRSVADEAAEAYPAHVAEQSYRRGLQHGVVLKDTLCVDPAKLRFDVSLDIAPYSDQPVGGFTSIDRLFMQCGVPRDLGFMEPDQSERFIYAPKRVLTPSAAKQRRASVARD